MSHLPAPSKPASYMCRQRGIPICCDETSTATVAYHPINVHNKRLKVSWHHATRLYCVTRGSHRSTRLSRDKASEFLSMGIKISSIPIFAQQPFVQSVIVCVAIAVDILSTTRDEFGLVRSQTATVKES